VTVLEIMGWWERLSLNLGKD